MTKYRLAIGLLWSIGFVSLLCLLMNLDWLIGMFLIPGGLFAFAFPLLVFRRTPLERLRRIATRSIVPATAAAVLACVPALNPMWPHGMHELATQETELQTAIPLGMSLEQVRGVLNSRKIQFYESTQPSDGVVLQNPQETITAQSGDTVLVSRFETEAFEYPCGYDMQIVLVFGNNRNLKQRYVHRFRMCP